MPSAPPRQNTAATNAQKYFRKAEQSEASANQARKTERQNNAAKTAKLRGLRLAKEQADKAATEEQNSEKPASQPPRARARAVKAKRTMIRMSY
jgi:hypothetical protein